MGALRVEVPFLSSPFHRHNKQEGRVFANSTERPSKLSLLDKFARGIAIAATVGSIELGPARPTRADSDPSTTPSTSQELGPTIPIVAKEIPSFPLPDGAFYVMRNDEQGVKGYGVRGPMMDASKKIGFSEPVSREYMGQRDGTWRHFQFFREGGVILQADENRRVVLDQKGNPTRVEVYPVMDALAQYPGINDRLTQEYQIPRPEQEPNPELLNRFPTIKDAYTNNPLANELFGLPTGAAEFETVRTVRFSNGALQENLATGEVSVVPAGQIAKDLGLIIPDVALPLETFDAPSAVQAQPARDATPSNSEQDVIQNWLNYVRNEYNRTNTKVVDGLRLPSKRTVASGDQLRYQALEKRCAAFFNQAYDTMTKIGHPELLDARDTLRRMIDQSVTENFVVVQVVPFLRNSLIPPGSLYDATQASIQSLGRPDYVGLTVYCDAEAGGVYQQDPSKELYPLMNLLLSAGRMKTINSEVGEARKVGNFNAEAFVSANKDRNIELRRNADKQWVVARVYKDIRDSSGLKPSPRHDTLLSIYDSNLQRNGGNIQTAQATWTDVYLREYARQNAS